MRRLLVANRGEIAARILASARELDIYCIALATVDDTGHAHAASEVVFLPSPAAYLSIDTILSVARDHKVDAIHPGYGFLSESDAFAVQSAQQGILVVGPGAEILRRTGDKLAARLLAEECRVPCLPAMTKPTDDVEVLDRFARDAGLPIMLKAVDGGGGRGIRLVRHLDQLASAARLAINESPSRQVFAERAAVDGFRHIEVQILGDGTGRVAHLFERECSIQRRYQKIVEIAPSTIRRSNPQLTHRIIQSAVDMAKVINYNSLGTFEFLANPKTTEFFFLEVNPRLQVEHTITECICGGFDIVRAQLLLAQGHCLDHVLADVVLKEPTSHAIQLRVTAENPEKNWALSVGKITSAIFAGGNGVRIDTALHGSATNTISSNFDSLIAKLVVSAPTWDACVRKAQRALFDTKIVGVQTNLAILRAITAHADFAQNAACDTQWLEGQLPVLLSQGRKISSRISSRDESLEGPDSGAMAQALSGSSSSSVILRKGDAWKVEVGPVNGNDRQLHHIQLQRILRNELPASLSALLTYATPSDPTPTPLRVALTSTSASAGATTASANQRRGDTTNPAHVIIPFAGKLVEVLVSKDDSVQANDVVCVVQQMKMELEVRTPRAGQVKWILEANEGDDVGEGVLACELELDSAKPRL